jgi:hypothetical protein
MSSSISDYFLRKLKEHYATPDNEAFCYFIYNHETVLLNAPDKKYEGHFLAMLKIVFTNSNISGVFVRPYKLEEWLIYAVFDNGGWDINNVPEYARENAKDFTFFPGWWTISGKPKHEDQFLLVLNKLTSSVSEQVETFCETAHPYRDERVIRLDLVDYNPFHETEKSYCNLLFNSDPVNLKYGYIEVMEELNRLQMATVKDKESLVKYIWTDINKNHIDIQDPINIDSEEIESWLGWLQNNPTPNDIETGVLILNRVISFCKLNSKTDYAVKIMDKSNNIPELVITYWSKEHIKNFLMKFVYFVQPVEEEGEESEEQRPLKKRRLSTSGGERTKKKKEKLWYDTWMKSRLRGECDGKTFAPWSLKNPARINQYLGKKYLNNRTINEFSGYNYTYEECKAAFITKHGERCIKNFKDLIERVLCGNNSHYFSYVHKWLAWILQKPDQKTKVAIIFKSQMGMGKGFIGKILDKWFGKHFYLLSGTSPAQKFNGFLHRKKIVFIDEVSCMIGDMAILNSLITEEKVAIETKGVDQRNETNLAEFIGATNETIRIKVGSDTRRWVIIEAPTMEIDQLQKWKEHMSGLYTDFFSHKVFGETGVKALMYLYLDMDIREFIPYLQAPKTEAIKKCMEYSLSSTIAWWKYIIERRQLDPNRDADSPIEDTKYTWPELFKRCRTDSNFEQVYGGKKFILTEGQFKNDLESVSVINYYKNGQEFKFRPWREQYSRWNKVYPDIALCTHYNTADVSDVFTLNLIERMESCIPLPGISLYTDSEKDYIITKLTKEIQSRNPNVDVTFNTSFYLRKGSNVSNKDIIELT